MLTLNMTSGNNNETIWVLKINTPTPIYLSTRDITLDAINYDGQVLNFDNYLTDITQTSTILNGGGTGAVSSFGFSISRYVGNTSLDGFFNEFYPATGGIQLSSIIVQLGIVWEGATTESEITWLMATRIIDYNISQRMLTLGVFEEDELQKFYVPYYEIQNVNDDNISYFPDADNAVLGVPIPIIYGGFNTEGLYTGNYYLSPAILVDKKYQTFIIASHECSVTSSSAGKGNLIYKYISSVESYLILSCTGSANTNSYIRHSISLQDGVGYKTLGRIYIRLTSIDPIHTFDNNIPNVIDNSISTYDELPGINANIGLQTLGSINTSDIGILSQVDADISVNFRLSSDGVGSRDLTLDMLNESNSVGVSTGTTQTVTGTSSVVKSRNFGTLTTIKNDANLPYKIEEVCSYTYIVNNSDATLSNHIRVYNAYVFVTNIYVTPPRALPPSSRYGTRTR